MKMDDRQLLAEAQTTLERAASLLEQVLHRDGESNKNLQQRDETVIAVARQLIMNVDKQLKESGAQWSRANFLQAEKIEHCWGVGPVPTGIGGFEDGYELDVFVDNWRIETNIRIVWRGDWVISGPFDGERGAFGLDEYKSTWDKWLLGQANQKLAELRAQTLAAAE